jgi:hypothetical protein
MWHTEAKVYKNARKEHLRVVSMADLYSLHYSREGVDVQFFCLCDEHDFFKNHN